jgi:putative phosphoesterase
MTVNDVLQNKDDHGTNMEPSDIHKNKYVVGVIADTHGLLRPEVLKLFENVDLILHAGDIGGPDVLEALQQVAPVTAVRGNMDYGTWAMNLPESRQLQLGHTGIFLIHNLFGIHFAGAGDGIHAVISGHTHRPQIDNRNDILFMNPGSAGYRRQLYPVSIGLLCIDNWRLDAKIIDLDG